MGQKRGQEQKPCLVNKEGSTKSGFVNGIEGGTTNLAKFVNEMKGRINLSLVWFPLAVVHLQMLLLCLLPLLQMPHIFVLYFSKKTNLFLVKKDN